MSNIIDDLRKRVGEKPDDPLYAFLDGAGRMTESYTYREFDERTNFVAAALGRIRPAWPSASASCSSILRAWISSSLSSRA